MTLDIALDSAYAERGVDVYHIGDAFAPGVTEVYWPVADDCQFGGDHPPQVLTADVIGRQPHASDKVMAYLEPAFCEGFDDVITMPSGSRLLASADDGNVHIQDMDDPWYEFQGLYDASQQADPDWTGMTFSCYTQRPDGVRHSDLFGARLLARCLNYFGDLHGQVERVTGEWYVDPALGVNYQQYHERLQALGKPLTADTGRQAAAGTWTGRALGALGFRPVQVRWAGVRQREFIQARFERTNVHDY
jgi:hypothetical protein